MANSLGESAYEIGRSAGASAGPCTSLEPVTVDTFCLSCRTAVNRSTVIHRLTKPQLIYQTLKWINFTHSRQWLTEIGQVVSSCLNAKTMNDCWSMKCYSVDSLVPSLSMSPSTVNLLSCVNQSPVDRRTRLSATAILSLLLISTMIGLSKFSFLK